MSDCIVLRGLRVFARHGVLPEEAALGQAFVLDVVAHLDLSPAGRSDDPADTVSYAEIAVVAEAILSGRRFRLLEAAAEAVAAALFRLDARIARLELTLHKPGAPLPAVFDDVAVTIDRSRA